MLDICVDVAGEAKKFVVNFVDTEIEEVIWCFDQRIAGISNVAKDSSVFN